MRRRIKAVIFFVAAAITLFAVNAFFLNNHNPMLNVEEQKVNTSQLSPQKLFDHTWQIVKNEYYDPNFNRQYWIRWKNHYRGKIKTADDAKVAIETMLASLDDPYSRFLTKEEFAEQNISIASKISGIGVNIINDSGKIKIISVIENTPAQFADLKVNDTILSIDGKKVSGLSLAEVSNLVKGPVNTFVNIDVLRNQELVKKRIIRKEISIKTVKSSVEKNIGYIQILSFISNSTPNEFLEALENTDNTDGLIIDIRGNTGGLLPNAVFVTNLFIPKGKIVSIVGRNNYHYDIMAQDNNVNIDKPVIILVDGASASASEIFSGAMKDYHRAKLIGTKTYGKGMVQKIISMPNETGINLTIAKYLTPKGKDINKQGINPDVILPLKREDIIERKDTQLETAKNMMEQMISSR
ncbi:MAG: S41 family peptidase [Candidatus Gastranaerophilales bacterium]|nr:S41 family peptidase [Candidatus Gastranaerophilales bacterium]